MSNSKNSGFIALIAVLLMASGTMAFLLTVAAAGLAYSDMVLRREYRIIATGNLNTCVSAIRSMAARYYFFRGKLRIDELGCDGAVSNDMTGHIHFEATSTFNGVKSFQNGSIDLPP